MSTSIFIRDTPVASSLSDCWPGSKVDGLRAYWPPSHTIWPTLRHQSSGWLPAAAPDTLAVSLDHDRLAGGLQAELTAFSAESDEWLLAPDGSVLTACEGSTPSRTCALSLQPAWGQGFRSALCCWLFNPRGVFICPWDTHSLPISVRPFGVGDKNGATVSIKGIIFIGALQERFLLPIFCGSIPCCSYLGLNLNVTWRW